MNCPVKDETYLCETPCMDKCPYQQGAKEFAEWLQENVFIDTDNGVTVVCDKEFTRIVGFLELYAEWQKGNKNEQL